MIDQSITLCGNLTKDVEFFGGSGSAPRAKFRIAHNSRWLDSSTGEWKDSEVLFMDVVCWRAMAQNVRETVGRGDPVVVVGRLRSSTWTDAEKVAHTKQEIEADVVAVDLRRGVTSNYRKVTRNAGDSSAFTGSAFTSDAASGSASGAPGADAGSAGEPSIGEPGFGAAASALERELVGAGAEPPF